MKLRLIMLLVIGPLFALAGYLMFDKVGAQRALLAQAHANSVTVAEGAIAGSLVHELQKERGYSAGFISSAGGNFPQELGEQRRATDENVAFF
ncbi:nitrate- and nitrite sensing domain-containing protein [Yoonia sp. BS5-3]|uniref:Nitrate- and nitrite sensing domain-containing protein n=1 Tax=Yoonia phaeophyticola TaxID=3137369 RepID=A0ABZ2V0V7_9RHOB